MTRRAYLYFVITFIIGVIVGGAGTYYYAWGTGRWRRSWREDSYIHNMTRELSLTPQQVPELRSIIDDHIRKYEAIQDGTRPQREALHAETQDRIRQILYPAQVKKFDQLLEERKKAQQAKNPGK